MFLKEIMKKFLSIILLTAILLTGVSCTKADDPTNNELDSTSETTAENPDMMIEPALKETTEYNGPKHYEFYLNSFNCKSYLTFSSQSYAGNHDYLQIVSGVLTFAYYENVVVTFDVTYESTGYGGKTYKGEYSVLLNAAGDAEFYVDNPDLLSAINCSNFSTTMKRTFSIKQVSGKVMFSV